MKHVLIYHRFRKLVDLNSGEETYCSGECLEYKTVDYTPGSSTVHEGQPLHDVLQTFHMQLERTSKILYLSNRLRRMETKAVKRLNNRAPR